MTHKIGLMGCGVVAGYGHLPALVETDGLTLHAVYDPSPERAQAAAAKFGAAHACTDTEAFFNSGIEAVTITSPAPCHLQNLTDAARHRLPVLCEKPLAMSEDEARRMIDIAEDAGIALFTGFDYRFSPVAMKIRRLVAEKAIGEVRSLRLIYIWHCHGKYETGPDGQRRLQARRAGRMDEGGPMVDCGVHQVDLARWWMQSEVVKWTAAGAWVDEFEAPDHVYLHLDHASGAHSMVEISYSYCHTAREPVNQFVYELIGTDGLIRYDRNAKLFEMRTTEGTTSLPFGGEKNFAGMYEAFANALSTGDAGELPTGWDGLMAAKLTREATDALIAGRTIS